MDVAVIGVGAMGERHAHAVADHPAATLHSVVDVDRDRAETVAERYGATQAATDYAAALGAVDAAVVATPESAHAEQAGAVMDRGVDLLLEKPIAGDLETAASLADRADAADTVAGVSFVLRYDPGYAGARSAVRDGEVGTPVAARAMRAITAENSRKSGARGHPLDYMNIHDIDAIEWCLDSEVTAVAALERTGHLDVDVPDATQALFRLANGATATLAGYGVLPAETPGGIAAEFEVVGTGGRAAVETPDSTLTVESADGYDRPDTRHWPVVNDRMDGCVRRQIDRFVDAATGGVGLLATVRDGYRAQAVAATVKDAFDADGFVDVEG